MYSTTIRMAVRHLVMFVACMAVIAQPALAQSQPAIQAPPQPKSERARELFVPFENLDILLSGSAERVFLTRDEFEKLSQEANVVEEVKTPFSVQMLTAGYRGTIGDGRGRLSGTLVLEILDDGLHVVPLKFSGVGLKAATLDGAPASLAKDGSSVLLLVGGKGRHTLELELTLPVAADAARQTLEFQIPTAPANSLVLEVPGNVEVKSGAAILGRQVDTSKNMTTFDLLLSQQPMSIIMSLNNRKLREESTVMARGVVFAEVTAAYERLHATMSMNVLNGATDEFRFAVDNTLEVYSVVGEELNRWFVEEVDGQQELVVKLQSPATTRVVLNMRLDRKSPQLGSWSLPLFYPRDVAGNTSVIGLITEARLRTSEIDPHTLIPIDASVLTSALPQSFFEQEVGKPTIEAVAAFYATNSKQQLTAELTLPPNTLEVFGKSHFVLSDAGLSATAGFTLTTENEKLFACDIVIPSDFKIERVLLDNGTQVTYESFEVEGGADQRIRVQIPGGVAPDVSRTVWLYAKSVPQDWLGAWDTQSVELPTLSVIDAEKQQGIISFAVADDLVGNPAVSPELQLLDEKQVLEAQLDLSSDANAYSYDTNSWTATIEVSRKTPRQTALVQSFFRIEPEVLVTHYELSLLVEGARTKSVQFSLPDSTPDEISIRGLAGVVVKESSSSLADGRRLWTVELAEKRSGVVRLAADFSDKIDSETTGLVLPVIRAEQVDYQSGTVSVEGHSELDTQVTQHPRAVDVGELVDAEYQVGRSLLGTYGYVGTSDETVVDISRRPIYSLPTTIVERAELFTLLSAQGIQQTAARYRLKTKAAYLETRLPAGAVLWAVNLDGVPALPHRANVEQADNTTIVALPANASLSTRELQIVYELQGRAIQIHDQVELLAPELYEREGGTASPERVPTADLVWEIALPDGYEAVRRNGITTSRFSISWLLKRLWEIGGGGRRGFVPTSASFDQVDMALSEDASVTIESQGAYLESRRGGELEGKALQAPSEAAPESAPPMPAPPPAIIPQAAAEPARVPPPAAGQSVPQRKAVDAWALEGVRSLTIDLEQKYTGQRVEFSSLGTRTRAALTLADSRRFSWAGWAIGLLTLLLGLGIKNWISRLRYLLLVAAAALLVPVALGWERELAVAQWSVFGAVGMLGVWYVFSSLGRQLTQPYMRIRVGKTATMSMLLLGIVCLQAAPSYGQSDPFGGNSDQNILPDAGAARVVTSSEHLADLLQDMLKDASQVAIPDDAILIPYNLDEEVSISSGQQLWVPYKTYQQLLKQIERRDDAQHEAKPIRPYALAGVNYQMLLDSNDSVQMSGQLTIEQFVADDILIPLDISGCVLESATLNNQPARLHLVSPKPVPVQKQQAAPAAEPTAPVVMLVATGVGTKTLDFVLRFKTSKVGGWRGIEAKIPVSPAGQLTLTARRAGTDIRFSGVQDRETHESQKENQELEFALPTDGKIELQWRDKIEASEIDQGLSVNSRSIFDVQEDSLRLAWQADLEFRRSRRDSFTLHLPKDYLVERVVGGNVRGWTVEQLDEVQQLDVELLKAAEQRESFALVVSRPASYDANRLTCETPQILVPGAMLHQGQILIRRSTLLDIETVTFDGLSRTDFPTDLSWYDNLVESGPLPLKNYQAYEFTQPKTQLTLNAGAVSSELTAQTQTLLKISQRETSFETRLLITALGRDVHELRIELPKDLEIEKPELAGQFEWSLSDQPDDPSRKLLGIYLANGFKSPFPVVLRGTFATPPAIDNEAPAPIQLPKFILVGASNQAGAIVVQADPAYEVRAGSLVNCETALLESVSSWLGAKQRRLARIAITYSTDDYSGVVTATARTPAITNSWLTNVKVTDRAIEETILILARIELAGIREFTFQLPASLANARIQAPLLRRKSVTPTGDQSGDPVQVRLELQDAVMGQFMVVVEYDRLLTNALQTVPTPVIETGSTQERFIALENASRDELMTEQEDSLRRINDIQFGENASIQFHDRTSSKLYSVVGIGQPNLQYQTVSRETVETAGARIGLAQTLLIVDEFGGYRGMQEYRVENQTEPYLEIELPDNAELWTVTVDGAPVKPASTAALANAPVSVRIPLIRTAEGDLDYAVILKYGGSLSQSGWPRVSKFPFLKTTNINVELSQVRLRLPESSRWFNFSGSVGRVETESDLKAGWLSFRTRQLSELTELLGSSQKLYSKARASNNLKALNSSLENAEVFFRNDSGVNAEVRKQLNANSFALQQAQEQILKFENATEDEEVLLGNRAQVVEIYSQQQNERSYNVVEQAGQNFPILTDPSKQAEGNEVEFDSQWLLRNSLDDYAAKDKSLETVGQEEKKTKKSAIELAKPDAIASSGAVTMSIAPPGQGLSQAESKTEALQSKAKGQITGDYRQQVERYNRRLQEKAPDGASLSDNLFGDALGGRSSGRSESKREFAGQAPQSNEEMQMDGGGFGGGRSSSQMEGLALAESSAQTSAGDQSLALVPNPQSFRAAQQMGRSLQRNDTAFMASLDVDLAVRGREFLFTTPGGQLELSAQSVSEESISRLQTAAAILGLGLVVIAAFRVLRRVASSRSGRRLLATLLLLVGSISLVGGIMPIYGVLCLLAAMPILFVSERYTPS